MADKTVVVRIALKAGQFQSGLGQAASAVRGFGVDVARETDKAASSATALGLTSAAMGKLVLLGIGGAMAVSAKAAIDFESSLAGVAKTTDLAGNAFDKANSPLATFGQAIRNLSMDVPVNVNDLNKIAELGGQLGIEVPNLIAFTDTIARLAVSTNLTIEEAATGLARIANIMGTPETEFERLGSVLVELGNNFATTEGEILSFSLRIAPVAAALGSSEEAVFGLSAALTSLGIPAERGGTAVQRVFVAISQAVNAGGTELEKWADAAGVSVQEFVEAFRRDPAEAFALFVKGLDDINQSGGSVFGTLKQLEIQEQRTIQVLLAAAGGHEIVADALRTANIEGQEVNALQEESARRFGTTASQLQLLANSFNDLRIEVGGMILGGGGLTAAVDVLREFFRILTENMDTIPSLVGNLALLAAIPLVIKLGQMATKAITAFQALKTLGTATTAAATAQTRLNAAMALSNVVLSAATLGIGILITSWINAAIEAAELRARIRALNDTIESGVDPLKAYRDSLVEANILSQERRRILADLGISEHDFIQALMEGRDVMELLDPAVRGNAASWMMMRDITKDLSFQLIDIGELATDANKPFAGLAFLVDEVQGDLDAIRETKILDLTQALFNSGRAAGKTKDEIRAIAEQGIDALGIGVTQEQFLAWLGQTSIEAVRLQNALARAAEVSAPGERDVSFIDAMFGRGAEGETALDDWTDRIVGVVADMQEELETQFQDVRTTILGGMPTSAEYEQAADLTKRGLAKILAAQDRYLEDVMSWTAAANSLQGRVSFSTMEWFNSLDDATRGAFGRLFAESPAQFEAFVAELESGFMQAEQMAQTRWDAMLPGAMRTAFGSMFAILANETANLELTGAESADAIIHGIEAQLIEMGPETAGEYIAWLQDVFGDPETAAAFGFDVGDPLVQGIIDALATLAARAKGVVQNQAEQLRKNTASSFGIKSPSTMTMKIGHQLGEGLIVGLVDSLKNFDPVQLRSQFQTKIDSISSQPSVNLTTQAPVRNVKIEINHKEGGVSTSKDLQLAGIVGSVLAGT